MDKAYYESTLGHETDSDSVSGSEDSDVDFKRLRSFRKAFVMGGDSDTADESPVCITSVSRSRSKRHGKPKATMSDTTFQALTLMEELSLIHLNIDKVKEASQLRSVGVLKKKMSQRFFKPICDDLKQDTKKMTEIERIQTPASKRVRRIKSHKTLEFTSANKLGLKLQHIKH